MCCLCEGYTHREIPKCGSSWHDCCVHHLEGKKAQGVGKQNFQYAPGFKEFMLILHSHGLHVYKFITKHIPMMEDRSILCVVNPTFLDTSLTYIKGSLTSSIFHTSLWAFASSHLTLFMTIC